MDVSLLADLVLRSVEFPVLFVAFVLLMLFLFGGSVGSFLNVVVYRLPLGLSLVSPGSRCPGCGTPILARDNIPVFGWLKLRGRCRACRCWISARYPLVECVTALVFIGLALCEPLGGGWNLPIPQNRSAADAYPLWGTLLFHFAMFCGLLAAALMTYDGEAVPPRMWQLVWLAGFAFPCAWPLLRPVETASIQAAVGMWIAAPIEGLAGTLLGIALGAASWPASSLHAPGRSGHISGVAACAVVGVFLGWQAAAGVAFLAALAWSTWQLVRYFGNIQFQLPWLAFLTATTVAWLFAWRYLVELFTEFGDAAPWHLPPVAALATLVVALAGRTLADSARRGRH